MIAAAPEVQAGVNATRLGIDWRPVLGVTPADAGCLIERLLAEEVIARAVEQHNADAGGG